MEAIPAHFCIEITRRVVSYRALADDTPDGEAGNRDWLDGSTRTLQGPVTTYESYDSVDAALWGDVVAWAVELIGQMDATEPSLYPVGDQVGEHAWLSGRYDDPYEGDSKVIETSVRLTGGWTPRQRADVFRAVSRP